MEKKRLNNSGINGDFLRAVTNVVTSATTEECIKLFSTGICFGCLTMQHNLDMKTERDLLDVEDKGPLAHWRVGFEPRVMFIWV